jgi:hypothetical protein
LAALHVLVNWRRRAKKAGLCGVLGRKRFFLKKEAKTFLLLSRTTRLQTCNRFLVLFSRKHRFSGAQSQSGRQRHQRHPAQFRRIDARR